jgi:ubiquinone/menaquinone biosynthesis C-methylase UbiE
VAHNKSSHLHRWRLALFLLGAVLIFGTTYVLYAGLNTLRRLDVVEAERDTWQRPADVLHALDLREGNMVVDLGAGAGYFALKLSPAVGRRGQVLAVDIRKLSLSFLWIRAALREPHNIQIIVGEEDDPHLPAEAVDAILIANTYHEFRNPSVMLGLAFRSLRSGGRLVVVDRGPRVPNVEKAQHVPQGHEITIEAVQKELQQKGFEIVGQQYPFIDRPGEDSWWIAIARKP